MNKPLRSRLLVAALILCSSAYVAAEQTPKLELRQGDRIAVVGNTFAERMIESSYFETLLMARFPDLHLTVRNLGWSGDTINIQLRPLNFGDQNTHLRRQRADVIFLCFGMAESFDGTAGLASFKTNLRRTIEGLQANVFNNREPPRLLLVSPIPHERLGSPLPDPTVHNAHLKIYTQVMGEVASETKVPFVDLYHALGAYINDSSADSLTFNGIHLTRYGDWVTAQVLMDQLGFTLTPKTVEIDALAKKARADGVEVSELSADPALVRAIVTDYSFPVPPPPRGSRVHAAMVARQPKIVVKNLSPGRYVLRVNEREVATEGHQEWSRGVHLTTTPAHSDVEALRSAVRDKNEQFFYRWRAVNGEYIYGRRAQPFGVVSFPPEMEKLDRIVTEHDNIIGDLSSPVRAQAFELTRRGDS